ncbi:MAG: OstA-like protein [Algibacter sp.]|uniref:OstA-like protein n=1 Tax=Algibacter sp. TaxID=1872428 RepID=UPI002627CCDE|nr:OstA-like protein [Algibacter sp.]MDG1730588.1 OstA-like protein [Algibacter sp.]MDG2178693.1 OstA-like protein [Algibacter sp.]
MNKLQALFFILLFGFVSKIGLHAQSEKKIKIEYAGKLTIDEANYPGAKILTRDDAQQVHIEHGGANMWCDKAIHYSKENFIEAYGNVILKQGDTINMSSKYIEYSGLTELAFASGDVVMKDPNSTISSDTLYLDRTRQQAFYKSGGKVVKDSSGTITSKIGRYYMDIKKYQFVEDVVLVSDESTINSNYFDFYSDTGYAYLFGPSTITTETSKTYCEKGFYDTENKVGYALKKSKIDYDNRIIEGDSLYFDNNKSFASATNNITVTDTINKSIIKGHYAEVFKEKDSVFIIKRALAITVQEQDSVYIHADKIMVTGKPENRIIKAYYNAKIFKTDLSGKSDSIHSDQKTGVTKLLNIPSLTSGDKFSVKRKPILWNLENQMTGDTIHLLSNNETEKIDSLLVFENAFIISRDTISKNGYNQINGKRLVGLFNEENQLRQVDVTKNAQSIFYARNDEQELIGIDKSKSGSISILFDNGDIDEYTRYNQIDGNLFPESKFPEKEKFLKGFDWREEERPKSVEDLFKDDPPLELPIIKGLEDYVPQEAFFDESLNERINASKRIYKFKNNKEDNLILFENEFDNPKWEKSALNITPNTVAAPNGKLEADQITGTGDTNGYIVQVIDKIHGGFKFTIWLKGDGETKLMLQEVGNDYTRYNSLIVKLTNNWEKYQIEATKENDGSKIRCVLSSIQSTDKLYSWGAEVIKITKPNPSPDLVKEKNKVINQNKPKPILEKPVPRE